MIRATLALLRAQMRIALREKSVFFFNYAFPLLFFFLFGEFIGARESEGAARSLLAMVLSIGIFGNGLFGLGLRSVIEREQGILRRMHLAPISPAPVLLSSLLSGLIVYLPAVVLTTVLARVVYHLPIPENLGSFFAFVIVGTLAFRGIGLIIGSVANSMAEAQILIQILYFPMLFLSGTTFPVSLFPDWLKTVAKFIPATYLTSGLQGILQNGESFFANATSVAALLLTTGVAVFLAFHLFRWDKEDKLHRQAKVWVVAVLAPVFLLGAWETYRGDEDQKQEIVYRQQQRNRNWRISSARVFVGDGKILERADVYVRNGKIVGVREDGEAPTTDGVSYTDVPADGKTVLPGLVDVHTHLGASGLVTGGADANLGAEHALRAYLYSGVTAVKSVGDQTDALLKLKRRQADASFLGAELFMTGPLFTAPGGHGTEYGEFLPPQLRDDFQKQMSAAYNDPAEASRRVDELAAAGVDGIKAVLESGGANRLFERMDLNVLRAVVERARVHHLPVVVHTGTVQDIRDAVALDVAGIEHGEFRNDIPDDLVAEMKAKGVRYDPTLTVIDSFFRIGRRDASGLDDPLIVQTISNRLLNAMRRWIREREEATPAPPELSATAAFRNVQKLHAAGVPLVIGTDSGNAGAFHGPAVFREIDLWKSAGIPTTDILRSATFGGAQLIAADDRMGKVATGYEANLLIVDGNPVADLANLRRISDVFFKGERIRRSSLFESQAR